MSAIFEQSNTNTNNTEIDLTDAIKVGREEMEGLTALLKNNSKSIPLTITYDNITVHEFHTGTSSNPHHTFNLVKDFAENEIDAAIAAFETKDTSKTFCQDSWQIKNGFVTIDICLHCYTEYDQSDFVFEDVATHRVVVSIVAHFDTKKMYISEPHATEVFSEVAHFYAGLKTKLTE